ncbi:hypothetical protein EDD16DRAFT_1691592 [Pisolithus croceorrhizus]|nr:hypothetical protein EDD16DRAFT_1691592 [Pisolithus croceorrhizus]
MPPTRDSCHQRPMQQPDSTPQLPCDQPGCNCWFRNLSGLMKHKCTTHLSFSHPHQSFSDHAELLSSLEEEDPAADRTPLLPEHAFHGYQAEDPLNPEHEAMRMEYVDPSGRLYHNYHPGLNENWAPYRNWLEFKLANFLFTHAEMPARKIDTLLDIWAALLIQLDLYRIIDSTCTGDVKWENFAIRYTGKEQGSEPAPWTSNSYEVWYRDPHEVIHGILTSSEFTDELDYRHWQDFMSGDWAWEQADRILSDNPTTARATLVPIILGSDKTTISVATGQTDYYPLYLSIRNMCNTLHCAHQNAVVLIGFLAMPKTTREHASTSAFHKFKRQLFHSLLTHILYSLHHPMKVPETVLFGNSYYQCVIYALTAYIADYEEQVLLSCIICNWCPKCLRHCNNLDEDALCHSCEHCDTIIEEFELHQLWDSYGIVGDIVPFTNNFPHADIHAMLLPDILHQLIKGRFKDHLVDWVKQIAAVAPFARLRQFPQGLMKVYITAIEGHVPKDIVCTFRAFLKFCYLICALNGLCSSITESKHIKAVKCPYWCTNHFQALRQMLLINQRLDKLTTVHADFKGHALIIKEGMDTVDGSKERTASYKEESGEVVDDQMAVDAHCAHARNVGALASELGVLDLPNTLHCFLYSQLYPNDPCDPEDIPYHECPVYKGRIHVDLCRIHGMHREYIHSCPMWRSAGPHYDCVFIVTNPQSEDMSSLDVAHMLCFFSFKYQGTLYPCTVIHWFDHVRDGPDTATGMWVVHPGYCMCNLQNITIAVHLIPVYAMHNINSADIKPHHSYDMFHLFYVNKYADHHTFKIAF